MGRTVAGRVVGFRNWTSDLCVNEYTPLNCGSHIPPILGPILRRQTTPKATAPLLRGAYRVCTGPSRSFQRGQNKKDRREFRRSAAASWRTKRTEEINPQRSHKPIDFVGLFRLLARNCATNTHFVNSRDRTQLSTSRANTANEQSSPNAEKRPRKPCEARK